jgi:effector-binding domain-containing protein
LATVTTPTVTVATVPARPTAVVPTATTWAEFPSLWGKLLGEVYGVVRGRQELETGTPPEAWQNIMLYKDDRPTVEVGVLVAGPFESVGRVVLSELPGGRVATAVHRGDYARLGDTHGAIRAHVKAEGLELAGPLWEIYGHPGDNPDDAETEIYHLLR